MFGFIQWLETINGQLMYHGSPSTNRQNILTQGLIPQDGDYLDLKGKNVVGVFLDANPDKPMHDDHNDWYSCLHPNIDTWEVNVAGIHLKKDTTTPGFFKKMKLLKQYA